jgi:hypothetical protein
VFVTTVVRTSAGPGPAAKQPPRGEAVALVAGKRVIAGQQLP